MRGPPFGPGEPRIFYNVAVPSVAYHNTSGQANKCHIRSGTAGMSIRLAAFQLMAPGMREELLHFKYLHSALRFAFQHRNAIAVILLLIVLMARCELDAVARHVSLRS